MSRLTVKCHLQLNRWPCEPGTTYSSSASWLLLHRIWRQMNPQMQAGRISIPEILTRSKALSNSPSFLWWLALLSELPALPCVYMNGWSWSWSWGWGNWCLWRYNAEIRSVNFVFVCSSRNLLCANLQRGRRESYERLHFTGHIREHKKTGLWYLQECHDFSHQKGLWTKKQTNHNLVCRSCHPVFSGPPLYFPSSWTAMRWS